MGTRSVSPHSTAFMILVFSSLGVTPSHLLGPSYSL